MEGLYLGLCWKRSDAAAKCSSAGTGVGSAEGRKNILRSEQTKLEAEDPEVRDFTALWPARSKRISRYLVLPPNLFWCVDEWFVVLVWFCEREGGRGRVGEGEGE